MTLKDLRIGESAVVKKLNGEGPLRRRLIDMGVTPGTRICIEKVAPLGDPVKVVLRGYNLSLRKEDALKIEVVENSVSESRQI